MHWRYTRAGDSGSGTDPQGLCLLQREHDGLKAQTQDLVVQAERKRETARSKAEAASMLEATAAARMAKLRASEEAEHRRLERVRAGLLSPALTLSAGLRSGCST